MLSLIGTQAKLLFLVRTGLRTSALCTSQSLQPTVSVNQKLGHLGCLRSWGIANFGETVVDAGSRLAENLADVSAQPWS